MELERIPTAEQRIEPVTSLRISKNITNEPSDRIEGYSCSHCECRTEPSGSISHGEEPHSRAGN